MEYWGNVFIYKVCMAYVTFLEKSKKRLLKKKGFLREENVFPRPLSLVVKFLPFFAALLFHDTAVTLVGIQQFYYCC